MKNAIMTVIRQRMYDISVVRDLYYEVKKCACIISTHIAEFQCRHHIIISSKDICSKELFLCQCNGLELNRPDITIFYLAVKDIVNGKTDDCVGLKICEKFWYGDGQNSDILVDKLNNMVNSFVGNGHNIDCYLTCDKKMELIDGSQRLACALFFGEKTIRVRNTITNWTPSNMWIRMINAGLSDEEIDFIRHESDLLVESIINDHKKEKINSYDLESLRKWVINESKKIYNGTDYNFNLYQSFPMLGIKGVRPTDIRIEQYGLKDLLNSKMDVLDIGCNIGFMDMEIASLVRSVTGIEFNSIVSRISKRIACELNIDNVTFVNADFKEWVNTSRRKYDLVFSFSIYRWVGLDPQDYADKITSLIKPGGFVFFEGHNVMSFADELKLYGEYIDAFVNNGFRSIKKEYIMDDGLQKRIWTLLQYDGSSEM